MNYNILSKNGKFTEVNDNNLKSVDMKEQEIKDFKRWYLMNKLKREYSEQIVDELLNDTLMDTIQVGGNEVEFEGDVNRLEDKTEKILDELLNKLESYEEGEKEINEDVDIDLSSQMSEVWFNNPNIDIDEWKRAIINEMNKAEEQIRIEHRKERERLDIINDFEEDISFNLVRNKVKNRIKDLEKLKERKDITENGKGQLLAFKTIEDKMKNKERLKV